MTTLANVDKAKFWATIFLLLAIGTAWLVGDSLFFSGLVGAVFGWWFGAANLASRLKNGRGSIGRAKFWAPPLAIEQTFEAMYGLPSKSNSHTRPHTYIDQRNTHTQLDSTT